MSRLQAICSQLELAVVVDAGSLGDWVIEEEISVGKGGWQRANRESCEVGRVLVDAEVALVVPGEGAKEQGTGCRVYQA